MQAIALGNDPFVLPWKFEVAGNHFKEQKNIFLVRNNELGEGIW